MQDLDIDGRTLLDSAPDGILVADAGGRIRLVNQQVEDLFGYTAEELIGQSVELLMPQRYREKHTSHRDDYASHPVARPMGPGLELIGRRKNGTEFPVEISLSPMETAAGQVVTTVIRDVSERRRLQEESNALRVELETERERHRIGMDLHDGIMQSIYAVALRLELILDITEENPEVKRQVERAIEELHDVSRDIRSYVFDLRPRQFAGNFSNALMELADEFQQNSQIETQVEISPGLPTIPTSQAVSLYLVVHEALSNVRKHARASRVSISLRRVDPYIQLSIADDGTGFDPGGEVPERHRGLRNMKARARAADAVMSIESQPGGGTSVNLRIPA
jgi:PAS domain S-box-containing protein